MMTKIFLREEMVPTMQNLAPEEILNQDVEIADLMVL